MYLFYKEFNMKKSGLHFSLLAGLTNEESTSTFWAEIVLGQCGILQFYFIKDNKILSIKYLI